MPSHPFRLLLAAALATTLATAVFAAPAAAHPHGPADDQFTFVGGGWGHGAGMSQYGALGRAEAGMSHEDILAFYFEGAELTTDPGLVPDDVDVRIAVHSSTVFRPSGTLSVAIDGSFLDTTLNTLTVRRADGGWHINSSNIDWCGGFCGGTALTVSFNERELVAVSNTSNGTERYAYGQFQLTPAGAGVTDCGSPSANEYCLVIGDMEMQQYLYGLDEVYHDWPVEAQKAQAIAGRSFAAALIRQRADRAAPFDLYTSTRDQEYRAWDHESEVHPESPWTEAVDSTEDTVLVYSESPEDEPEVISALYVSSNGGHTAANEEPHHQPLPYLVAKPDPYDAAPDANGEPQNPTHAWERTYTAEQISGWLAEYPFGDLDVGEIQDIYVSNPGPSGRIDDARVTLVGSERTLEVLNEDGEPYGYRFFYALARGCEKTPDCDPMLSTKFVLAGAHGEDGYTVYTLPFTDVAPGAPYAPAVAWLLNSEITSGTSLSTFSPDGPLTRAQFATFLWRFAGEPEAADAADAADAFDDVAPDSYYAQAVAWMTGEGITTGCSAEPRRMCPDDGLATDHAAAFLWRFAGRRYSNHRIPFSDIGVNDYYLEASRWMVEWDLWVDGEFEKSDGSTVEFEPGRPMTRAGAAVYLWLLAAEPGAFDTDVALPPLMREL